MRYWLYKSEPSKWSWDEQVAAGAEGTEWTGVRNYQARNFMREMKRGERGFFYHSNEGKAVVGVVEVVRETHPDSTADDARWECVDIRAVRAMPQSVALEAIKAEAALKSMVLVGNSRLSVQPVTADEFAHVCRMGGLDPESVEGTG